LHAGTSQKKLIHVIDSATWREDEFLVLEAAGTTSHSSFTF